MEVPWEIYYEQKMQEKFTLYKHVDQQHSTQELRIYFVLSPEKDLCVPDPCKNEGRCDAHGLRVACYCALGYKGEHCEGNIVLRIPTEPLLKQSGCRIGSRQVYYF